MPTLAEEAAAAVGLVHQPGPGQVPAPLPRLADLTDPAPAAVPGAPPVIVVPGFATRLTCARVIGAYEEHIAANPAAMGDGFFDGRVLWKTSFPEAHPIHRVLHGWQLQAERIISTHYGRRLFSDNLQVVKWPAGLRMPPHRDDRHPDETEKHNTPYREFAALVYLNDDYREGEIYFPELRGKHKPVAGQLVFFPGKLWHGVEAAVGGARYTSPQWFTDDPAHRDPTLGPPPD